MIGSKFRRSPPSLLALDFDGVLCDGLEEYFHTAWLTCIQGYDQWQDFSQSRNSSDIQASLESLRTALTDCSDSSKLSLKSRFFRLRPVIETGWEMPLLIFALLEGRSDSEILADWRSISTQFISRYQLNPKAIAASLDRIRDQQIAADLSLWLSRHRFYPGVIEAVQHFLHRGTQVYIITTKEGRFVDQLLQQTGLKLPTSQIFGKAVKRPKYETLRQLSTQIFRPTASETEVQAPGDSPDSPEQVEGRIWFVEDRLEALQSVKAQADLAKIELFLADWGYNTAHDRTTAAQDPKIQVLSLPMFCTPTA